MAEPGSGIEDSSIRLTVSRQIFLTVMEALEHEQRANTPILMSMAFLTAAASAIFAATFQRIWQQDNSLAQLIQCHPILTVFSAFIILILIGTAFSVAAQRSQLELPKNQNKGGKTEPEIPKSLIFWKTIPDNKYNEWLDFFKNSTDPNLALKVSKDYIREAYYISKLVEQKHVYRGWASFWFQIALIAFGIFLGFALNVVIDWGFRWSIIFGSIITIVIIWINLKIIWSKLKKLFNR